jgi:hypothetical protein
LTPRVIKNPLEVSELYQQKKEHINTVENGKIKALKMQPAKSQRAITIPEPIQEPESIGPKNGEPR